MPKHELPDPAQRFDPYKAFKLRIRWDGTYVAAVSKVSGLKRTTDVVEHRSGGDPSTTHKSPGRTRYQAITLERGVTHDTAFQQWAGTSTQQADQTSAVPRDIVLEEYDEDGQPVLAYTIFGSWISEYQALPDLDAGSDAVAIQHIKLENEGWQLDTSK